MTDTAPIMSDPLRSLTTREKDALRLLAKGHDAKSVARELDLSVHTVNERLRDVRQKLRVSSSREAARIFAESEGGPQSFVDVRLGMAAAPGQVVVPGQRDPGHRLAWFAGGMLVMSCIIAALIYASIPQGAIAPSAPVAPSRASTPIAEVGPTAASRTAEAWLALLDHARWQDSWRAAAPVFTSQVSAAQWATMAAAVRDPLGKVSSRSLVGATSTSSLPGVPPGDYQVVQFATKFAGRTATETVVLAHEGLAWKVAGYFVK